MVLVLNKREKLPMETTQGNTVSLIISQYSISDLSYCTKSDVTSQNLSMSRGPKNPSTY